MTFFEKFSSEKGFGLRATKRIKKGTHIMVEAPFVHLVYEEKKKIFCDNCCKKGDVKACSACKKVFFCSKKCQRDLWGVHKYECTDMKQDVAPDKGPRFDKVVSTMLFRILVKLKSNIDWEKKGCLTSVSDLTEGGNFHPEFSLGALKFLSQNCVKKLFPKDDGPSCDYILHLLAKLRNNAHGIYHHGLSIEHCSVGSGLYMNASLLNHSCDPNCMFHNYCNSSDVYIIAIRDIPPGEELTISYCKILACKQIRQKSLETYGFKCDCNKCHNDIFEEEMLRKKDGSRMTESEVDQMEQSFNGFKAYSKTLMDEYVIEVGNALIKDLAPCNIFTIKVLIEMSFAAISINNDSVVEYYSRFIPYEEKYRSDDQYDVGMSHCIFSNAFMKRLKFREGKRLLEKALEIFSVYLAPDHEIIRTIKENLRICEPTGLLSSLMNMSLAQ